MAEVRKRVVEDKYNTSNIKIKEKKNKGKTSVKTPVKKSNSTNEEKKSFITRFRIFWHGVGEEFHKVHWTSKKDMVKYSIATIFFIVFLALFFFLIEVVFARILTLLG